MDEVPTGPQRKLATVYFNDAPALFLEQVKGGPQNLVRLCGGLSFGGFRRARTVSIGLTRWVMSLQPIGVDFGSVATETMFVVIALL